MIFVKALVIYYSRTGITEELAHDIADRVGGDIEKIDDGKQRKGLLGFIKSGWDSFIENKPEINQLQHDVSQYDIVIIGTPIWAGNISAPVRSFITSYRDELNKVAFFCTFAASGSDNALNNMQVLTGKMPESKLSLRKKEIISGTHPLEVQEFIEGFTE